MSRFIALTILLAGCGGLEIARETPRAEHVVIISFDGLRPEAIERAPARALRQLIARGAYCPAATNTLPSETLPNHVSMLTGLDTTRHGIEWDEYRPVHYRGATVFSIVKSAGGTTAMFFGKPKFAFLARPGTVDVVFGPPPTAAMAEPTTRAPKIAEAFARAWERKRPALAFIHLRETDFAGHAKGWMSEGYLAVVRELDAVVDSIVETIRASGALERTAIIVTSDHGGTGINHDADVPENRTIPWICAGPGVREGVRIERPVKIYDTAATALSLLGFRVVGLDGRPVGVAQER